MYTYICNMYFFHTHINPTQIVYIFPYLYLCMCICAYINSVGLLSQRVCICIVLIDTIKLPSKMNVPSYNSM